MASSFSVRAILSAKDSGFTSTMKSALKSTQSLSDKIKSGIGFGILMGAGQKAFNSITNGISGITSELGDNAAAWKTFEGNMGMLGKSSGDIKQIRGELQDFATQTIYSASDMATTFSQLEAVGVKNTTKLVKGFGGLAAAAENPKQAMKTLSVQATQMAAKPTVAWMDFKLMLEQTPAGIAAVAKKMGKSTSQLVQDVQAGTVATEEFLDAVAEVGTNDEFTKLATSYKTVNQALDGLSETVSVKLGPAFGYFSDIAIKGVEKVIEHLDKIDGEAIVGKIQGFVEKAKPYWDAFAEGFGKVSSAFGTAFSAIGESLAKTNGAFGDTKNIESFKGILEKVTDGMIAFAGFLEEHSDAIAKFIELLPKLALGFMGLKAAGTVAPYVMAFAGGISTIAGKITGMGGKLTEVASGQEAVGNTASTSSGKLLQSAQAFLMMGAGILMICGGFYLLAQASATLAESGPVAIGVMFGMVGAVAALGIGFMAFANTLAASSAQMTAAGIGLMAMGAAVLLISAGFYIMAQAAIQITNAGGPAISVMFGMIAVIALLAVGAALLGPALTAGAIGMLAFGAAVLMVGIGVLLASVGMTLLANTLPLIATHGAAAAVAIIQLGIAMMPFAAGAMMAGTSLIILGAGLAIAAVGMLAFGVATLAAGVGLLIAGAGLLVLTAGLPIVAQYGMMAAAGIMALSAGVMALGVSSLLTGAGILLLGAGLVVATVGMVAFGAGTVAAGAAMGILLVAVKAVSSSMRSISKDAASANTSIISMTSGISVVQAGLDALGSKAKGAVKKVVSAFQSGAPDAQSAGQKLGTSLVTGMTTGLDPAPARAIATMTAIKAAFMSGANMYDVGAYIGSSLASGMESQLGRIQSVANQMAAAAEKAIRAKSQVHSPSPLYIGIGRYIGGSLATGVKKSYGAVKTASAKMMDLAGPNMSDMRLATTNGMSLSDDYSYGESNQTYTFYVKSEMDGREVAKGTATYTKEELEKIDKRNRRKEGRR